MSTVYRLKAIEIIVSECDETEDLLKSEVNKNRLLKAIENIKEWQNLV